MFSGLLKEFLTKNFILFKDLSLQDLTLCYADVPPQTFASVLLVLLMMGS